jgi:ATP-dependent DNA ligase
MNTILLPRTYRSNVDALNPRGERRHEHLGLEGIVSKRLRSPYRSGRSVHWVKVKNPNAPAVKREAKEDLGDNQ